MQIIKLIIKHTIGINRVLAVLNYLYFLRDGIQRIVRRDSQLELNQKEVEDLSVYSAGQKHTFFGYYDLQCFDKRETIILAHTVPLNANTRKTPCQVGYFRCEDTKHFYEIANTNAWCWQQGARLRFNPLNENEIMFNAVQDNAYCTMFVNIKNPDEVRTIPHPLYDVDHNLNYGLSLNFSRLQRLRPGYGYDYLPDETKDVHAPIDDGVFLIDMHTSEKKLIFSLAYLAQKVDPELRYDHYINHISIAPDDKHFIFFHIWKQPGRNQIFTRLYVSDITGKKLIPLETNDRVSHYCWKNEKYIFVTCISVDGKQYYALYNIKTTEKKIVGEGTLLIDGHPTFVAEKDKLLTDTYPRDGNNQRLLWHNLSINKNVQLLKIYSDSRLFEEKRCDLHPRLSPNHRFVTVDSTFERKHRSIVLLKLREKVYQ